MATHSQLTAESPAIHARCAFHAEHAQSDQESRRAGADGGAERGEPAPQDEIGQEDGEKGFDAHGQAEIDAGLGPIPPSSVDPRQRHRKEEEE